MPLIGRDKVDKAIEARYLKANDDLLKIYLRGMANIIKDTPVDKGTARNNWFFSIGAPSSAITTSSSNGLATIRELRKVPKRVLNRKLYLTNNLPYIGVLEYGGYPSPVKKGSYIKSLKKYQKLSSGGFSLQAPGGWVRKALMTMQSDIRKL